MSINALWQGWSNVMGDKSIYALKDTFGMDVDFRENPEYQKDMVRFQENPTTYNADKIINKWGDDLGVEDYKELSTYLKPAEGTMQAKEYDLRDKQIGTEMTGLDIEQQRNDAILDYDLPTKQVEGESSSIEAQLAQNEFNKNVLEHKNTADFVTQLVGAEQSGFESTIAQNNLGERQAEVRLPNVYEVEDIRMENLQTENQMNQERLYQFETQNKFLEEQMENELSMQEQNLINQEINNEIGRLNRDLQRELNPLEVEQVKSRVYNQNLNNRLAENEVYQSNIQREAMEGLYEEGGIEAISGALGLSGGENTGGESISPERIIGTTADGRNVYSGVGEGYITTDPRTGEYRSLTREELDNANIPTMEQGVKLDTKTIYEDPMLRQSYGEENLAKMLSQLPEKLSVDEYRSVKSALESGEGISEIMQRGIITDRFSPELTFEEALSGEEPQPDLDDGGGGEENPYTKISLSNPDNANNAATQQANELMAQAGEKDLSLEELEGVIMKNFDSMQQETDADLNNVLEIIRTRMNNKGRY